MLRDIAKLPDFKPDGWFNQFPANHFGKQLEADAETAMSEDFSFCMRAKMAGYQLWADTGLLCSHMIGPKYSTKALYDKYWAKKNEEIGEFQAKQRESLAKLEGVAS